MKRAEGKTLLYEEPKIGIINAKEPDVITTSGDGEDHEGEIIRTNRNDDMYK